MKFTVQQIADILEGEVHGNAQAEVFQLSKIEEGTDGALTFLANPKYEHHIYTTKATATIVSKSFVPENSLSTTLIKVDDGYKSYSKLLEYYNQVKLMKSGFNHPLFVSENVKHGENIYLGTFSYIDNIVKIGKILIFNTNCLVGYNAVIGDNTILFAVVRIYSETVIGNNCTFLSVVIIGSDGFAFAQNTEGSFYKVPQIVIDI